MPKNWYMIYTRQNSEKKICALLKRKKIENFCPVNRRQIKYFGKNKFLSEPLFYAHVFARLSNDDFYLLDKLKSVLNVVYWKDKPAVIQNEEIESIKEFVHYHLNIRLEKSNVDIFDSTFTNDRTYTVTRNSLYVKTSLIRVQLPSIGFVMLAETQRENTFQKTPSPFANADQFEHQPQ